MCQQIMDYLEEQKAREAEDPELVLAEQERQRVMQAEARVQIRALAAAHRAAKEGKVDVVDLEDDWDDDDAIEVEYVK